MSCFYMPNKLKQLPSSSKKAWKSFTSTVSPKLRNLHDHLKLPKSFTKSVHHLLNFRHKRHSITGRSHRRLGRLYSKQYQLYYHHLQQSATNSPATVYVDRLFSESLLHEKFGTMGASTSGSKATSNGNTSHDHGVKRRKQKVKENNDTSDHVKWKEYISSLPPIRGVDERAEDFISTFRQQMQLQREQSIVEFQEMLARST